MSFDKELFEHIQKDHAKSLVYALEEFLKKTDYDFVKTAADQRVLASEVSGKLEIIAQLCCDRTQLKYPSFFDGIGKGFALERVIVISKLTAIASLAIAQQLETWIEHNTENPSDVAVMVTDLLARLSKPVY
jgi:hypothetical protein